MKFTPEVIAALATLRNAAENDFERHRLDVLERDLTAPPVVEVIDDTYQKFNGVVFHKDRQGHYVTSSTGIHRFVWQYYVGNIPEGYHIHHSDFDKSNNKIENLQLLTKKEHSKIHRANLPYYENVCEVCGKTYLAPVFSKSNRFCSAHCRNQAREKRGNTERTCAYCGKKFFSFRSSTGKCCSYSCASKLMHKEKPREKHYLDKNCAICGKTFTVTLTHKNQECCSLSCSRKLMWRRRKDNPKKVEKTCPVCGIKFQTTNSAQKHCSASCREKFTQKKKEVEKICPVCGSNFITSNSIKIYCSKECCDKSYPRTKKKQPT